MNQSRDSWETGKNSKKNRFEVIRRKFKKTRSIKRNNEITSEITVLKNNFSNLF